MSSTLVQRLERDRERERKGDRREKGRERERERKGDRREKGRERERDRQRARD